jgi:hypothetical protein
MIEWICRTVEAAIDAGVRSASGYGAVMFAVVLVPLDVRLAAAAGAAAPQLGVQRLQVPCAELVDRDRAECRPNVPLDVPDIGPAGRLLDLDRAQPLAERPAERNGRLRRPLLIYLRQRPGHHLLGTPMRGLIGALDRSGQVPVPASHRVLAGVHPDLKRGTADAHAASPSPAVAAACGSWTTA